MGSLTWETATCLFILASFQAQAASNAARTASALVPDGYVVTESIRGDLNKDGQADYVLLVKATDKSEVVVNKFGEKVDRNRRGLIIAFRNGDHYELAMKNLRCFSSENEDGGVYFPPELSISAKNGSLILHYGHGRYGYWKYNFRLQKKSGFELIGYDSSINRGPVVERFTSINLLSRRVLTKININKDDHGGDERFKETWSKISSPKSINLLDIADFDELSVERILGLTE